jgi:myosin heavy chain 6/7
MIDASKLADELRQEQEHAMHIEKLRKQLEMQVKEMQVRLDEAEAVAMKGGKKALIKMEQRVKELEAEYDAEQRRHQETQKNLRKADHRLKELLFQGDEDKKSHERMQDLIEKLNAKLKTYKRQVEEAEEIAAINLAKFKKVQNDLQEAEERADLAEQSLNKIRAKSRNPASVGPGTLLPPSSSFGRSASPGPSGDSTRIKVTRRELDISSTLSTK